jgi:hypothetical protein
VLRFKLVSGPLKFRNVKSSELSRDRNLAFQIVVRAAARCAKSIIAHDKAKLWDSGPHPRLNFCLTLVKDRERASGMRKRGA